MRRFVMTAAAVLVGFGSSETLVRLAVDEERPSDMQRLVFTIALCALLVSITFVAVVLLAPKLGRRRHR